MRITRMLVDLSRLESLEAPAHRVSHIGKYGFALSDHLSIELTDSADSLPACIADDFGVFGCIIGDSELVGGPTVRALKVNFTNRDVSHATSKI